ncbi:hypothetical protein Tco_0009420 [Tanacetum coccineum]
MADLLELGSSGCDLLDFFRHCKLLCASKACLINRLHPCLIANQLAQLAVEHPVQLVCTSSSSPCDMRIVLPGCGILSLVPGVLKKFEGTMFLNVDQLEKQLDKKEFQEIGSMAAFSMQTKEGKVDTSKALDASLVDTDSSGTESGEHDTSSKSRNDAHVDDADIRRIYDKEPMAKVPMTADNDIFATGQQHTEQLEFNNEGEVDQNAKQCHDTRPLPSKLTDHQTT